MSNQIMTSIDGMKIDKSTLKRIADLKIQAMLFDMDIDYETNSLVPKTQDPTPFWLKRWREHEASGDRTPEDYEGGKDER